MHFEWNHGYNQFICHSFFELDAIHLPTQRPMAKGIQIDPLGFLNIRRPFWA
jgi:hypothetical protein